LKTTYIIEERVIERAMADYPDIPQLVEFSTPVVSFGYPKDARVATLGINPSSNEFQVGRGNKNPLPPERKRLIDTESLGIKNPKNLTREQAIRVIEGCYDYFNKNHYDWFNDLEKYILKPASFSYFSKEANACHLDLVQWATDPVWQTIKNQAIKRDLLKADREFLEFQLTEYDFEFVFLNGGTVLETVEKLGLFKFKEIGSVSRNSAGDQSRIVTATYGGKTFLGWGLNTGYRATYKPGLVELGNWLCSYFK